MTTKTKKITKATFKSFIRKNADLEIMTKSDFIGMIDGCDYCRDAEFSPALKSNREFWADHDCGIHGVYLVCGGRDYFSAFENDTHKGIEVSNSCGNFVLAIRK